jgi:cytochrome c-type biogenesis protein
MSQEPSLFLAFTAGLFSFLSPCVLPLIPSYLSILGGIGLNAEGNSVSRLRLMQTAAGFVLGFSAVFVSLGILVSATFFLMGGLLKYINWGAGIIVIGLGLNIIFDFFSFLNYEKRPFLQKSMSKGIMSIPAAFIAGAAFGAGWTPCIGPILTATLFMASQSGKTIIAFFYLSVYSAGLALPFLLAALFFNSFLKRAAKLRSHLPFIRRISGILLIIIGLMILTGRYSALNGLIQKQISGYIVWAEAKAFPFRVLAKALVLIQGL